MDKPDKIFVCPDDELWITGVWDRAPDSLPDEATYLLATPERELASELVEALTLALQVIADAVEYQHSGDPWEENAFDMQELSIHEYSRDGRMEAARAVLAKLEGKG